MAKCIHKKTVLFLFVLIYSLTTLGQHRQQIDSLNLVLKNTNIDTVKINALISLGELYTLFSPDSSILFFKKVTKLVSLQKTNSLNLNEKNRFIYFNAYTLYCIGVNEMYKNNLQKANEYNLLSRKKYELINNKEGVANCLNNIGYIYFIKGDISNTLLYYNKALLLYKEINFKEGLAASYINTAAIYIEQGDEKNALKNYSDGLIIMKQLNNPIGIASCSRNIANIYLKGDPFCTKQKLQCDKESFAKALEFLVESLIFFKKINDKKNIAGVYNDIGSIYMKQKNINKAEEYYNLALKLSSECSSKVMMLNASEHLSLVASEKFQFDKALNYATNSLIWAKEIGYLENIKLASFTLKKLHIKLGNYKEALAMNDLWLLMRDSIASEANKKDNLKKTMQLTFDNRLFADSLKVAKEKEIINIQLQSQKTQKLYLYVIIALSVLFGLFVFNRLRLSNKQKMIIEEKNKTIQKSLQEKEVLLKEIHHRVKNNLQVISSLLGLQSANITDEQVKKIFTESKNKIQAISLIHQTLYQNGNLAEIDMSDYFSDLCASISSIFNGTKQQIAFNINTNNIKFDIDTSVPLGLIFNELITNSLKYAFTANTNSGAITVALIQLQKGFYTFTIEDNGQGFDTENTRTGSLGLKLVNLLASQLNGNCEINTQNGTKITITFEDTQQRKLSE